MMLSKDTLICSYAAVEELQQELCGKEVAELNEAEAKFLLRSLQALKELEEALKLSQDEGGKENVVKK